MLDFSGGGLTIDYTAEDIKHADLSVVSSSQHSYVIVFKLERVISCSDFTGLD